MTLNLQGQTRVWILVTPRKTPRVIWIFKSKGNAEKCLQIQLTQQTILVYLLLVAFCCRFLLVWFLVWICFCLVYTCAHALAQCCNSGVGESLSKCSKNLLGSCDRSPRFLKNWQSCLSNVLKYQTLTFNLTFFLLILLYLCIQMLSLETGWVRTTPIESND